MKALIHAPKARISSIVLDEPMAVTEAQIVESAMFVTGPAAAVLPASVLVVVPAIITAPGEMILKNGTSIDSRVMRAPKRVSRNSAQSP